MSTFELTPGTAFQCLSIPVQFEKEFLYDNYTGQQVSRCGFSIGGGIDQDYRHSPGFTDNGIYVTDVVIEGPAFKGGLRVGDKILSCNGYDFTMVSHKQAVDLIKRNHSLKLLVARKGVTQQ